MHEARWILAAMRPVTSLDARAFSAGVRNACWPGDGDRHQPSAVEWVRRWRPERAAPANQLPICACSTGHCVICN
jgi:hypothetical protein